MITIIRNGHGNLNSNHGRSCLYFPCANTLKKGMILPRRFSWAVRYSCWMGY